MTTIPYVLGCPFWSFEGWNGGLYRRRTRPEQRLRQYASVFNGVEGNTSFYAVPDERTVARWGDAVPEGFRFCFKLPRAITHEGRLRGAGAAVAAFCRALEPLASRLGPVWIQLPPSFGPGELDDLAALLAQLPPGFAWAVELRHAAFFHDEGRAQRADDLLALHGCDRVVMDTRALRAGDPRHPEVLGALHEKPDLPVRPAPIGERPVVRFVGHPEDRPNDAFLEEWAGRVAGWIAEGHAPCFFVHTASNRRTPEVARDFHDRLRRRLPLPPLPAFPGETEPALEQLPLL